MSQITAEMIAQMMLVLVQEAQKSRESVDIVVRVSLHQGGIQRAVKEVGGQLIPARNAPAGSTRERRFDGP